MICRTVTECSPLHCRGVEDRKNRNHVVSGAAKHTDERKRKVPQVKTRGGYRCKPVGPFDVTIKRSVPLRRERESERGRASGSAISAREKVQDPLCRSTLNPRNQTPLTKPFFTARYRCFPLPPPSLKKRYVKLDLGPLSDALFGAAAGRGVSIRRTEAFFCVGESLFWSFCGVVLS